MFKMVLFSILLRITLQKEFLSINNPDKVQQHSGYAERRKSDKGFLERSAESPKSLRRQKRWDFARYQVMENQDGPQKIATLHSSFDDDRGNVRYSIAGQGAGSIFRINPATGDLTVLHALDREMQSSFRLNVSARNLAGDEVEKASSVNILILDKNDNPPVFSRLQYLASILERSPRGCVVTKVEAKDKDDINGPYSKIVYSLLPSNGSGKFMIHPHTGVITAATASLDRETANAYELIVKARDDPSSALGFSTLTTVAVRILDVNDNPPIFIKLPYEPTVPEDLGIGMEVMRVKTKDIDIGKNAVSSYSIQNGLDSSSFLMTTDENVGVLMVKESLDYETSANHEYKLNIKATNTFQDSSLHLPPMVDVMPIVVRITDVNEPPVFNQTDYVFSVSENASPGFPISSVWAHDPEGDSFSYSLEDDISDFSINRKSGVLSVSGELDREQKDHYLLAAFAGVPNSYTEVTIRIDILDVNDNAPAPPGGKDWELILCENHDQQIQKLQPSISVVDRDDSSLNGSPFQFFPQEDPIYDHFRLIDNGDDTATLETKHIEFHARSQKVYEIPILVQDSGSPKMNTTLTVTVIACQCMEDDPLVCDVRPQAAGIRWEILLILLLSLLIVIVLFIIFLTARRKKSNCGPLKKESFFPSEDDVRRNFISYSEEGGGEEDTNAFDLSTLQGDYCSSTSGSQVKIRHLFSLTPSTKVSYLPPYEKGNFHRRHEIVSQDINTFIMERKSCEDENDRTLAFDSLQIYAYEGEGSDVGSLSSLCSSSDDNDHYYDYLREWGPRFTHLADIYNSGQDQHDFEQGLPEGSMQARSRLLLKSRPLNPK